MYKSADAALNDVQTRTHRWLQSLLDIHADHGDSPEFLEHIKVDLFPDEVYVFTPKGKIMALPRGATAVDFAFAVHTDVGFHCIAVKINYELMPLRTQLRNGDHVEILNRIQRQPQRSLAELRRHRQGALAYPQLPAQYAGGRSGGAGRALAQ